VDREAGEPDPQRLLQLRSALIWVGGPGHLLVVTWGRTVSDLRTQAGLHNHRIISVNRKDLRKGSRIRVDPVLASAIFVLGLVFGSFLNVCIYRLPRDLSVARPRSTC